MSLKKAHEHTKKQVNIEKKIAVYHRFVIFPICRYSAFKALIRLHTQVNTEQNDKTGHSEQAFTQTILSILTQGHLIPY